MKSFATRSWGHVKSAAGRAWTGVKNAARSVVKAVGGGGSGGNPNSSNMYAANTDRNNVTATDAGYGSDRYNIQDCYRPMEGDKGTVFQYHRFIWLDEEKRGYGLTTQDDSTHYSSPGQIKIERTNPTNKGAWGYHCKDLAISADQMTRLRQEIRRDYANPPDYHLKNYNCHNWVSDIFERSGIRR